MLTSRSDWIEKKTSERERESKTFERVKQLMLLLFSRPHNHRTTRNEMVANTHRQITHNNLKRWVDTHIKKKKKKRRRKKTSLFLIGRSLSFSTRDIYLGFFFSSSVRSTYTHSSNRERIRETDTHTIKKRERERKRERSTFVLLTCSRFSQTFSTNE